MKRRTDWFTWILWGHVAFLFLLRIPLLLNRLYDPDEFEHLHAGWSIAQGSLPYRDFFEHHGPVTYALSAALFRLSPDGVDPLHMHRSVSFLLSIATAAAMAVLARRLYGRSVSPWAILTAFTWSLFVQKSVEWRPDGIATLIITIIACLATGPITFSSAFLAGALAALAFLTTQKSAFLIAGILLVGSFRGNRWPVSLVGIITGALVVGASTLGIFAYLGILQPGIESLLIRPLQWSIRTAGPNPFLSTFSWAPGHQAGMVLALFSLTLQVGRRSAWRRGRMIPLTGMLGHVGAYFLAPVVYYQFFMLVIPLVAVMVAGELHRLYRRSRRRHSLVTGWLIWLVAGLAWMAVGLFMLNINVPLASNKREDLFNVCGALLIAGCLSFWGSLRFRRQWPADFGYLCWLCVLLIPSIAQMGFIQRHWSNAIQREDIAFLEKLVPIDGSVLEGFSGLGYRRPHASYWFWINEHTLPMLLAVGDDRTIIADVAQGKPALILLDRDLQRLPGLEAVLFARYRPFPLGEEGGRTRPYVFFLRHDLFPDQHSIPKR
jgi:hypothetical protein